MIYIIRRCPLTTILTPICPSIAPLPAATCRACPCAGAPAVSGRRPRPRSCTWSTSDVWRLRRRSDTTERRWNREGTPQWRPPWACARCVSGAFWQIVVRCRERRVEREGRSRASCPPVLRSDISAEFSPDHPATWHRQFSSGFAQRHIGRIFTGSSCHATP